MDVFAISIKEKYLERLISCEKQWPPCHSDKLVRLELVEREKGEDYFAKGKIGRGRGIQTKKDKGVTCTPLAYGDLFKVESGKRPVRKVLVEGDAGIGKTTLCMAISEDWANGKLFQQFDLVLLLPLRMKAVAAVGSIPELLKPLHSSKKVCSSVADSLEDMEGKKVLIIADGWDEVAESERLEGSFLYQLVFGELLSFVSVVLTSRPSASAPLHQLSRIDRFVEVCGFSKEHIVEYIESEFSCNQDKAGNLLEQLEYNPLIESVCSVPLNCAIVCHLWRTLEEALPTTMTELYTKIILNVILRNIQKKDAFKHIDCLTSFKALPKELQRSWSLLCKFAFEAIVKDQIVFSQEELDNFFPHGLANILCFGLLQTANTILITGCGTSFHFLHLTFQEYLAALYVVKQMSSLPTQQYELYLSYVQSRYDTVISGFICGIYFNKIEHTDFNAIQSLIPSQSTQAICRCAIEAKSKKFCSSIILDRLPNSYHYNYGYDYNLFAFSAYDCAAVLYVISNIQMGNLNITFFNNSIRENQARELADILAGKNGMLQVMELDLRDNKLTDESINDIFLRASTSFQSLSELSLQGNRIGIDSITSLGKSNLSALSDLNLSDCPLGVSGIQALEDAVCTGLLYGLTELNLAGSLTSDTDVNGTLLATSLDTIVSCNLNLLSLDLSRNNLGIPGASALARVLCRCKQDAKLQGLNLQSSGHSTSSNSAPKFNIRLDKTNLGDEGLIALVECSCHSVCVSHLSLSGNDIHATGISSFTDGVCAGKVVLGIESALSLDDNPLGLEGAAVIGRMLSNTDFQVQSLSLCGCCLTTPGSGLSNTSTTTVSILTKQLCGAFRNKTIKVLKLDDNSFTGNAIHILAGFTDLCPCLTSLRSSNCGITSGDLKQLLDKFKDSPYCQLTKFKDLSHCGITSDDLKQILDQLTKFKDPSDIPCCIRLDYWDLSNNQIDDKGAVALMDHFPSLFPNLGCFGFFKSGVDLLGNYIGNDKMREIREEMKRRNEEYRERRESVTQMNIELQGLQSEINLDILGEAIINPFSHPYFKLEVVGEKEEDKSQFSEKEVPVHKETNLESSETTSKGCIKEYVSPVSVHVPTSSVSAISNSVMIIQKQECYKSVDDSSDDDSETFFTPPTSLLSDSANEYDDGPATEDDGSISEPLSSNQPHSPAPDLKDLDLLEVVEWYSVGLQLGVSEYELKNIEQDYPKLKDRKREMFSAWLRSCGNTNYLNLIRALDAVGEHTAVQQIRAKNFV